MTDHCVINWTFIFILIKSENTSNNVCLQRHTSDATLMGGYLICKHLCVKIVIFTGRVKRCFSSLMGLVVRVFEGICGVLHR